MTERFGNDGNIHSRTLQDRCERVPSDIGSQFDFQPQLSAPLVQGLVHMFQHLAYSVVNLLLGLVYAAVEYRENIILVRMVGFGVFADNRFRLFREVAGHLLAGLVAGIVDSFLVHIAVTQGGDVFEIDACREVRKQENVPCEIQIG